jgi:hypothetical protein
MRGRTVVAGIALLLACATRLNAQADAARTVIERAVQAHGGEERLAQDRAEKVRLRGTLYVMGDSYPFDAEVTSQLPAQLKTVMEIRGRDGRTQTVVNLVNAGKMAVFVNGRREPKLDAAAQQELAAKLQLQRAYRLVPLLRERGFELAALAEAKVNDRAALGVRVTARGKPELRLFFDKELGLLVKSESVLDDGAGKQVREDTFYGDYKDVNGCKRFSKIAAYKEGKKVMQAEVLDIKYYERIDNAAFTRP